MLVKGTNIMRLYHGSINIIKKPIFGYGKKYNDYGLGFYCSENLELAKEWAVGINNDGFVNIYEIDTTGLKILNLNDSKYGVLHWLTILLENRIFDIPSNIALEAKEYLLSNFKVNYNDFDIIIGYRADDSYFAFAQDFLNGSITYKKLSESLKLGKLGNQIVLKSKKAFSVIKYIDSIKVEKDIYYPLKENRDKLARREYFENKNKRQKGDITIINIIDEEMKENDPRL